MEVFLNRKERIRENIELIIEQTDRMSHIIEHTRMFSRGADESELMPVQINEVIKSVKGLLDAQWNNKPSSLASTPN